MPPGITASESVRLKNAEKVSVETDLENEPETKEESTQGGAVEETGVFARLESRGEEGSVETESEEEKRARTGSALFRGE